MSEKIVALQCSLYSYAELAGIWLMVRHYTSRRYRAHLSEEVGVGTRLSMEVFDFEPVKCIIIICSPHLVSGYPPVSGFGGYPGQPPAAGYPGQPPAAGYPGQPPAAGYPGQPPAAGYPGQPPAAGYPGQPPAAAGYPGQPPAAAGYPGQPPAAGGYPGQPPAAGYPQQPPTSMCYILELYNNYNYIIITI